MKEANFVGFVAVICVIIGAFMGASISKDTTSDYWKTEIVRHGYGTWETTPDGKVWFKWKENDQTKSP